MPKFKVVTPVDFDGKRYEPDSSITLEKKDADPLLAVGAISDGKAEKTAEPTGDDS